MMPILFLIFSQAAVGGLALSRLAPPEAGQTFFRIMGGIFSLLSLFGLGAALAAGGTTSEFAALAFFAIFLLAYEISLIRGDQRTTPLLYFMALALGITSLLVTSASFAVRGLAVPRLLYPLNFLATTALLGSVIMGLALGHWYLAAYKMPLEPLKRLVQILILSALGIGLLALWAVLASGGLSLALGSGPDSIRYLILVAGRVVFGILAPAFLGLMTWDVLRYRKTTSATGILYVALAMVLAGELSARYLLVTTGIPW